MQLLDNNGYVYDDVWRQFLKSGNTLRFRYEHLDVENNTQGFFDSVVTGSSIEYNYLSAIKRTAKMTVADADSADIDFVNDRIRPWIGLQMPDGGWADWPQGIFLLNSPTRKAKDGTIYRDVEAYDQCQILSDFKSNKTYILRAGTVITDQITAILQAANIQNFIVVDSDDILPGVRTWDPGTSYLEIVNDLLRSIGYGSIWFDGMGVGHCEPYTDPDDVDPYIGYTTDKDSIVQPEAEQTLDLFSVPNVISLTVSQPGRPVLNSIFINSDPNSPVSTVRRGRRINFVDSSIDVATQSALDALARRKAQGFANIYEYVSLPTMIVPIHENRDTLYVSHDTLGVQGKFVETAWSIEMKAGGRMGHLLRRVVNIDASLLGDPDADVIT